MNRRALLVLLGVALACAAILAAAAASDTARGATRHAPQNTTDSGSVSTSCKCVRYDGRTLERFPEAWHGQPDRLVNFDVHYADGTTWHVVTDLSDPAVIAPPAPATPCGTRSWWVYAGPAVDNPATVPVGLMLNSGTVAPVTYTPCR